MKRILMLLSKYEIAIWIRFFGSAITSTTNFMIRPFLILYLYERLDGSIILPLVIVGLQPLASIAVGFWGGGLSDYFGRKPIMITSLLIQTCTMIGFIFADSVWMFAALSFLNGFGVPLFVPAANAQITDIVKPEKRAEVFALLHTAFNVGPAVGPLIGLVVFAWNQAIVFAGAAAAFSIYALVVWWKVPETLPLKVHNKIKPMRHLPFRKNKFVYLYTLFSIPIGLLYAQVETTLPLHLKTNFENNLTIMATLFTINAFLVLTLMVWMAKKTEQRSSEKIIFLTYILFGLVSFGYGFAPTFLILILVEVIFSFAEMIGMSHLQKFVSLIAPTDKRGHYFSIFGMYMQIPSVVGPLVCGLLFSGYGGGIMFSMLGLLLLLGGFLQYRLIKNIQSRVQVLTQNDSAAV
ncbi:MDR family MFS transporter [Paenibacillus chitinolyticus]|uniref:MDR family MFS transporter n=1 Tax=Paenibacillus chitinolyticus TaxID=79263 RepID=UPI0035DA8E25